MKNSAKYLIVALIIIVGVIGVSFYSCEKEEITPNEFTPTPDPTEMGINNDNNIKDPGDIAPDNSPGDICGDVKYNEIYLDNGKPAGKVKLYNDKRNLFVELVLDRAYSFDEAFMHIAGDVKEFPMNNLGDLDFESFQYNEIANVDGLYRFTVPLISVHNNSVIGIACKMEKETDRPINLMGWVGDIEIGQTVKGRVFKHTKNICEAGDQPATDLAD